MHVSVQSWARTSSTVEGVCIHTHTDHTLVTLTLTAFHTRTHPHLLLPGSGGLLTPLAELVVGGTRSLTMKVKAFLFPGSQYVRILQPSASSPPQAQDGAYRERTGHTKPLTIVYLFNLRPFMLSLQ